MKDFVVGIDIGGTNFRIGAVTDNNEVYGFEKIPVTNVFHSENVMEDLEIYLEKYLERQRIKQLTRAISIGFPATINKNRTVVLQAPNVPFMEELPIVEYLQKRLNIPVFIERDVCMTLFYDKKKHHIPDKGIIVGYYFGTGIGNAICINGEMLLGKDGVAGEIGHIKVDGYEEKCGCGNCGCIENIAGGKYLEKLCSEVFQDVPIGEIFLKHRNHPLLLQYVERMAITVTAEINILNPDYILIGGGIPNMDGFPVKYLEEKIHEYTRKPYPEQNLCLTYVGDEKMKSVVGAAIYAHAKLK